MQLINDECLVCAAKWSAYKLASAGADNPIYQILASLVQEMCLERWDAYCIWFFGSATAMPMDEIDIIEAKLGTQHSLLSSLPS